MSRRWFPQTILMAMFVVACTTLTGEPPPGAELQPGFEAYTKYCAKCHGQDGRSERSSRVAKRKVSLIDPAWRAKTDRLTIERIILHGDGKMEGLGSKIDHEKIPAIIDYVLWLPLETAAGRDSLEALKGTPPAPTGGH
ncbi:MAG: cytochrome c [Candidatus Eisenbacteria bacterium]|uniref:Cytochrome c n=1 Tax=Eiseniibacteriota bacterium TaxID=2212470 RepID=A0A7Y2H357_UNCEI|nr:cytochrome c [Candidatus Eisenbacteria bacterium]